jgi:hypothetical protein
MQTGERSFTNFRNFIGVVEDRNDPEELGRLKVRVYSIHTEDNSALPTTDLPWAMVVQPVTSAAISGIGRSPTGIVEGTWVYGVFLDEGEFQTPLVIGTLAGKPSQEPSNRGFSDSRNEVFPLNDPGISEIGESSVSRLARTNAESHAHMLNKRTSKDNIGTIVSAKASKVPSVLVDKEDSFYKRTEWKEPHPRFGGQGDNYPPNVPSSSYPLNHVWFTEAGHVFEVDDTPKAERIHMYHKKGTFFEIQPSGDRMTKVVGNDYEVIFGEKDMFVKGNVNITINGDARTLIKGNKIEEIDGDYLLTVRGDVVQKIAGNEAKEIGSDKSTQINGNMNQRVSKNVNITTVGNFIDSIKGLFNKTVTGEESRTNLSKATHILPDNYTLLGANNINIAAGGDLNIAAEGKMKIKSVGNQTVESEATQAILAPTGTIDYNNGSIDVVSGNITDTNVTLHTHTHKTTSMDTGTGANSGQQNDSDSPTSGT